MPKKGGNHGSQIKDDELYERLREEGNSKEKSARIANQGNLLPTGNLVVQFYNGNPNNGAPQIGGDVSLSAPAGCGETTTAAVTWNNPTPGAHTIYVRVSAAGGVVESNTGNNVYSQSVVVP